jgi:antitoxin (DNA-binding transcriptional repressor) of toxin-antitoxin stability system
MKTLAVSEFKARCLGLLKEVGKTGNPLAVTLRGKALATVVPPQATRGSASVKSTLRRLQPLLMVEEEELDLPPRRDRASALAPLPVE